MKQKRLHLLLELGGIYLALLTIYLCLAAGGCWSAHCAA